MASAKDKELGVRNPFKWRAGIDFPTWEGVNRQNDPGAIRNSQFQQVMNGRINGNEVISRGGQSKTFDTGVDGCIYGLIDVDGGIGIMFYDQSGGFSEQRAAPYGSTATIARFSVVNNISEVGSSNPLSFGALADVTLAGISLHDSTLARNVFEHMQTGVYMFGQHDTVDSLLLVSFENDDPQNGALKVTPQFNITGVASSVVRGELTTNNSNEAMYIGSLTTGTVVRWDGVAVETETTSLGATRLIMFTYAGEVYAARTGSIVARNGGAWDVVYSTPTPTFVPSSAAEYQGVVLITGNDGAAVDNARVLSFNGSVMTTSFPATGDVQSMGDIAIGGGNVYVSHLGRFAGGGGPGVFTNGVVQFNGSVWSDLFETTHGITIQEAGALISTGSDLFWWGSNSPVGLPSNEGPYINRFIAYQNPPLTVGGLVIGSVGVYANPCDAVILG